MPSTEKARTTAHRGGEGLDAKGGMMSWISTGVIRHVSPAET